MPSNVFTEIYCVLHDARSIIAIVHNARANCVAPKGDSRTNRSKGSKCILIVRFANGDTFLISIITTMTYPFVRFLAINNKVHWNF